MKHLFHFRAVATVAGAFVMLVSTAAVAQVPLAPLKIGDTIPQALLQELDAVSKRDVGLAPAPETDAIKAIPNSKAGEGKPWVLYVGAEYCPYCAAMRWPLVLALMRFGTFSGLTATRSSPTDVDANTATVSFVGATFKSKWLELQTVELSDRFQKPLQKMNAEQKQRLQRYDRKPYTQYPGSIPFIDINDQWIQAGSSVSPRLLQGMGWLDVSSAFDSGKGPLWQAMLGAADQLTAKFCVLTNGQPKKTCQALGKSASD